MKCSVCGHSWLEGRAIEISHDHRHNLPDVTEVRYEAETEIRRLVDATREAQEAFATRRKRRKRTIFAWSALVAAMLSPFAAAMAAPEAAVKVVPASISVFKWMGRDINIYGLTIRKVETQHLNADGKRVIAIKGEILNTSATVRKIPWLRFGLKDPSQVEVYSWQLDTNARPLQPGESTNFVTRIASPPEGTEKIEIRFARLEEIGSYPSP